MDNLWTIRIFFDGDAADPAVYPLKSCSIPRCVGAAGTHAQQKATVSISGPTVSLSLKLVGRKEQTKAEIYEGTAIRFTGLIDTDWDFDAKGRLIESVSLTVMDYSGKLKIGVFGKDVAPENARLVRGPQRWQNYAVCDPARQDTSIVHQILKLAAGFLGITIPVKCDATCTTRLDYFQLEQKSDLKTQLEQLLTEFRLDYIFDADNSIRIISTDSNGEPVATVTDFRNSLRGSGSVYKPKSIKATWRKYERRVGEKIGEGYHKSDSVNSRSVEYGQDVTWSLPDGASLDDWEIVSIENLNPGSTWTETGVTHPRIDGASAKVTRYDLEGCHIVMERHGACAKGYIRARITADIVIRYNKTQELYSNPGTTQESLTLLHHHQLSSSDGIEGATEYAMYYEAMKRKAATTYTFNSLSEYAPGAIVTLSESSVTGISAKVRILEQTLDPLTGIYKYKAEGAGDLDLKGAITKAETSEDHPIYGGDFLELSADLDESTGVVTVVAEGDAIDYYGLTPAWDLNGTSVTSTGSSVTFPVRDLALSGNVVTCTATLNGETVTATYDIDQLLSAPTLAIFTGDGSLFPAGSVNATLSAVLMRSGVDVALANESVFRWTRTSTDTVADATWNASAKATGKRSVIITDSDLVDGGAVFLVSCVIGTTTYSSQGFSIQAVSDGRNGWSNATCQLFKRSASAPAKYDGSALTYTFSTATLAGNKGSWSITIPSGADPLYVIYAPAFGQGETDIVEPSDWTVPAILSENGTRGENGDTVATVMLYQRSASTPSKPTGVVTYNFLSGAVSNTGLWSNTVPASDGNPLWVITAVASVTGSSNVHEDTIQPSEWSTPSIMAKDGETGATGTSIIGITEYYLASASPTAPSASDTGWSTSAQTPTEAKPYLWNKTVVTYTSGSPTTTIAMIGQSIKGNPGATGATAKDFTLYQSSTFFEVSPRGVTHKMQVISITCVPLNITSPTITWSVSSAVPTQAISSDKTVLSLTVQSGVALADLTVTCSVSGIGTKTIKILATPVGEDGPIYLGTDWDETAATTDNGDPLRRGDYYLRSNDTMIRVYNGSAWENVTEDTATQQMMMDVTSTALRDGADVKTSNKVLYEYIGRLAAQSAFISRLQSCHITLTQTNDGEGSIQSDKYHWNDTVDNVAHVYYGWKINHDGTSFFTNMNARDINIQDGAFVIHDKQGNLACMSTDGNSDAEESHIARTSTLNAYLLKDLVETATELHRSSTDILLYAYLTLGSSTVAKGRCAYVTADQRLSLPSFPTHLQYISFSFNWDDSNTISKYVWGTAYNGDSNGRQDFTPTYSGTYTLRITGKYIRILGDLSTTRYSYSQFPREDIGTNASSIDPYKTVSYVKTVEMTAGTTYYIAYQAICAYAPNGAYKSIGECSATFTAQVNYTGEKGLVFIDIGAYLKATTNVVPVDVCYDESSNAGHIQVNLENNGYKHYYSSSVLAYTYARDFLASLSDIYGIYTTADKYTTTVVVDGVATEVEHDAPRTYSEGGVTVSSGYSEIAVSAGELSLAKQSSTYVLPASRYVKGLVYLEFYKTGYKRGMAVANLNATEEDSQIGTTSKPFAHVYAGNVDLSHNLFCGMILWYLCSKDAEGTVIPPMGFLLLDNSFSISRSGSYAALFARIEQAGAVGEGKVFHYGSDNNTIVAPDVEGRYLRIGNNGDSGNQIDAGLPNIQGYTWEMDRTRGGWDKANGSFSGGRKNAFYQTDSKWHGDGKSGSSASTWYVGFNAGRNQPIYGASNTVTPATVALHLIIGY